MSNYVAFVGRIEPLRMGRATYTILRIPDEAMTALGDPTRVEGEIADHPVNLALATSPDVDGVFVWAGQSLLAATGLEPGEEVELRLRPADPDEVDMPDDVGAALRAAGRLGDWSGLTPGKRRGLLYTVATAKRAETRARRIAALVEGLPSSSGT